MSGPVRKRARAAGSGRPSRAGRPFPPASTRPQADGDPGGDAEFAGDRSGLAEDVAQTETPENGGWSGVEDNVEDRAPGAASPRPSDPHHRGDRKS